MCITWLWADVSILAHIELGNIHLNVKFVLRKMNFTFGLVVSMIVNRLRELRESKMNDSDTPELWTQEGIAKHLGVTRQTIISMEKGTYNPSLALAFKLANLFGVKIEDIFEYRGEKNES